MFMVGDDNSFPEGYTFQDLILPDGGRIHFQRTSPCNGACTFSDAVYEATNTLTDFFGAILKFQTCTGGGLWTLTKKDGTTFCFLDSQGLGARAAAPVSVADRYGNKLTFARDTNHNLTQITSPNGRYIQLSYDSTNRITQA